MSTLTNVPTAKVMAGGGAGAAVTLTVLILNNYVPVFKAQPITGELASLATLVLSSLAAYAMPPGASETTMLVKGKIRTAWKGHRTTSRPHRHHKTAPAH